MSHELVELEGLSARRIYASGAPVWVCKTILMTKITTGC